MYGFRLVDGKFLRRGYTTGSCASAASYAAVCLLIGNISVDEAELKLPGGEYLTVPIYRTEKNDESAQASVLKDGGDDQDATNGIEIVAKAEMTEYGIEITGSEGVGIVTKRGLDQEVGQYAINSTPRRMIAESVQKAIDKYGYKGGIRITVSVPKGRQVAERTFNPNLGIVGGISILGTTGIVDPMSEKALIESMRLELKVVRERTDRLVILFGNYGKSYAEDVMHLDLADSIMCSNYIGEALRISQELGFTDFCLVGHIGKMIKLSMGIMDTHSRNGDGRIEALIRLALNSGCSMEGLKLIDSCTTTDGAIEIIQKENIYEKFRDNLKKRIQYYLDRKMVRENRIQFVCFSNVYGEICRTDRFHWS